MRRKEVVLLFAVAFGALLVHGYHPNAEDAEIYVPGIVKLLHPSYYPFGQEFFETHAHLTLFPKLIAATVKITRLPLDWTLFLWHFASILLFLLACWRIGAKCFASPFGRWCAVAMVAALLTLPVAGTSLYIFDSYLNPRSLSIFCVFFAIDAAVEKRYKRVAAWLVFTAVIHPFMTLFGLAFIFLAVLAGNRKPSATLALGSLLPVGAFLRSPSPIYWQCLNDHRYYFLFRWTWYEWLGAVAPLALLWWFSRVALHRNQPTLELLSRVTALFGLIFLVAGVLIAIPARLEILEAYQPMRSLQIVYVFLALFSGGLLGEGLLKNKSLRWLLLFVPLCGGMCYAQLQLFPGNRHVEWPGAAPRNEWLQAFTWIRDNTPMNAIFALDPNYMAIPGENYQGFRAAAQRSRLADAQKDWSAAVLYPWLPLADDVFAQTQAAAGWKHFAPSDFVRLKQLYGVNWVVLQQPAESGMACPYENAAVKVCRIE